MLIAAGCGKGGAASSDLNNYIADNSSVSNMENEIVNDTPVMGNEIISDTPVDESGLNNAENNTQTVSNTPPDIINSLTLSWSEPSFNADGSPLSGDLAGYIIYYGQGSGDYTESVDIGNLRNASVSDLTSGIWCFAVTAYDAVGNESDLSDETCKTIS